VETYSVSIPRLYLVPVGIFILLWCVGAIVSISHRAAIARLVNESGSAGYPVFIAHKYTGYRLAQLYICAPGHDPLPLGINMRTQKSLFLQDGTLLAGQLNTRPTGAFSHQFRFPNYNPVTYVNHDQPVFDTDDWSYMWENGVVSDEKYTEVDSSGFSVLNILTGEEISFEFSTDPPWVQNGLTGDAPYEYQISPDMKVLVVFVKNTDMLSSWAVWKYRIETGSWTRVCDINASDNFDIVTGYNADIIGADIRVSQSSHEVIFLDGNTGQEIVRESNAAGPMIGRNWAACTLFRTWFTPEIVCFNINANWARTTLGPGWNVWARAMYEPPVNGLEGMYENYDPDVWE
jgi:hypothetical protein